MAIISNFINQFFIDILALINISQDIALFVALVVKVIVVILIIVMCVAYTTWLERKIHGLIHLRKGPNVVGAFGLLQPLYDGIKLIFKETIIPLNANKFIFFMAPILTFVVALLGWVVIPLDNGMAFADLSIGAIYLLAISSLSVYGLIMAGYSSNSQFSLLGAIRSSSQMISYELSMGMIVLCVALISQ